MGNFPKPVRLQGTSVSTLTPSNATPTAKYFEIQPEKFEIQLYLLMYLMGMNLSLYRNYKKINQQLLYNLY